MHLFAIKDQQYSLQYCNLKHIQVIIKKTKIIKYKIKYKPQTIQTTVRKKLTNKEKQRKE